MVNGADPQECNQPFLYWGLLMPIPEIKYFFQKIYLDPAQIPVGVKAIG